MFNIAEDLLFKPLQRFLWVGITVWLKC